MQRLYNDAQRVDNKRLKAMTLSVNSIHSVIDICKTLQLDLNLFYLLFNHPVTPGSLPVFPMEIWLRLNPEVCTRFN